jgi:hypothetical protein
MSQQTDPKRNRPSSEGQDNDPNARDESAIQPGVSTISPSGTDDANQRLTHSAMDGPTLSEFDTDAKADATFDDIDKDEDR